jgi:class 3 adenylate cyclase/tetratricopeptide (TPR) repeat protein
MAPPGERPYHSDVVGERGAGVERSTAIVVFTDLVGSTELRSRLGEDAAEELRRDHDRLVAGAVEASRGRLVKNLGDGMMATFTGASDALAAAVAIQQALDRHNRSGSGDVPLEVRIGISAGDVTFEEADCFGTPVIEAARLCAAAAGGQILVTDVVRVLAGTGGGHQLAPVGALDLKGLPAPVAACEVVWEPLAGPPLPMPALLTRAGRIFVGRDEELERLLRLWKEAVAGERRVALLAGEPGIGKTRLAVELAGAVRESGGVVLAGRCDEDLGVPYQPFVEALRHYVTGAEERRLGRYAGELARLLPDLAELVGGLPEPLRSDPETERYRLFDALAAWLADVSAEAPVLLVLDDLHWAAKPTLLLLRHVLRSSEPLRLLVVVTYRDSDIGRGHPMSDLLAELRRDGGVERLALSGLDGPGVVAFVEAAAGHSLDDEEGQELPRVVWRETEGNPFFVTEVLRHLSESGAIEQRDGRWVLNSAVGELGIPEGVRDVVGRRLSRLAESTNRILATAAVVGLEFEPAVVERSGGIGEDDLFAALEEATLARLLVEVPGPRYRFAHALVRATLYDELTGARRVALHRRVAQAIESLHGGALDNYLPALAHHWARASAPAADTARAVDYATRAGDRALGQLAHDEAATYYLQALELLQGAGDSDGGQQIELLIALGEAQRRAGDPAHRETLLEASRLAVARGDAEALARAVLANTRGTFASTIGAVDHERVAALEAALDAVGGDDNPTRARILAALAAEMAYTGDRERRVLLADEALAIARRSGDAATLARVLLHRWYAIYFPDAVEELLANTEELLALAERLDDPVIRAQTVWLRGRIVAHAGDMEEANRRFEAAERLTEELGQPTLRFLVGSTATARTILAGDLEEGERRAHAGFALGQATGQRDAPTFLAGQLFLVRLEQDRLGELEEQFAGVVAALPGLPTARAYLARILCELDRPDEALEHYELLAAENFTALPRDPVWILGVSQCAAVAAWLGDRAGARVLFDLLAPYASQIVFMNGGSLGAVAHYLAVLAATFGDFDEAERHFTDAAAAHERIGAPIWLARTNLEWARMLLARRQPGDAERARELLGQALTTARARRLTNIERRAVHLLR